MSDERGVDLEAIRAVLAKATAGPWRLVPRDVAFEDGKEDQWDAKALAWDQENFLQFEVIGPSPVFGRGEFNGPDAVLIARAPEWLVALCDEVERRLPPLEADEAVRMTPEYVLMTRAAYEQEGETARAEVSRLTQENASLKARILAAADALPARPFEAMGLLSHVASRERMRQERLRERVPGTGGF